MGLDDIKYYIIGVIMFTVVIGGGSYITGSFYNFDNSIDGVGELSQFESSMYRASNLTTAVDDLDSSINNVDAADTGVLGWLNVLLGSAFNGLKVIGQSMGFMSQVSSDSAYLFGIPPFIIALITLVVTVIIVFAIYSAITRT